MFFMVVFAKHAAIKGSHAYNFFLFVEPGRRKGKVLASDGSSVN